MKLSFFLFIVILLVCSNKGFSQYKELGLFAGASNYQGDLTQNLVVFKETQPTIGAVVRYPFHPRYGLRFHYMFGKISGSDYNSVEQGYKDRGFTFESELHEVGLMGEFYLRNASLSNKVGMFNGGKIIPYLGLGIAVTLVPGKPVATKVSTLKPNPFPEAEDVDNFVAFPVVAGLKYFVSEKFCIAGEMGWRTMFSDYLDGISINANATRNDWYVIGGISCSWVFGVETCRRNF